MTGLASLIREFAGLYPPAQDLVVWQRSNFWRSVWITFILSALLALFLKHRELLAEKAKRELPEIKGRIEEDHLFIGVTPRWLTITYIPIVVTLVNQNQTETAVLEYKLVAVIDGKEHNAENVPPERIVLTREAFDSYGLPLNSEGVKSRYKDLFKH